MEIYYIFYYAVFTTISVGLAWQSDRLRMVHKNYSNLLILIVVLIFMFDSYSRGDRGTDTSAYREHFYSMAQVENNFDSILTNSLTWEFDLGYVYTSYISNFAGLNFEQFNAFLSAVAVILLFSISSQLAVERSTILLLYILSGFMFLSYNGVRQLLALLLMYQSVLFFLSRNHKRSILAFAIGSLFHFSSVYFFIASIIFAIFSSQTIVIRLIIGGVLVVCLFVLFGGRVDSNFYLLSYSKYSDRLNPGASTAFGYGYIVQGLINVSSLVVWYRRRNERKVTDYLNIIWVILYTLFGYNALIMRLAEYFRFAQILMFAELIKDRSKTSKSLFTLYIMLLIISVTSGIYRNTSGIVFGE